MAVIRPPNRGRLGLSAAVAAVRDGMRRFLSQDPPISPEVAVRLGLGAALFVLFVDQFSKWVVLEVLDLPTVRQIVLLPILNLTMVWNQGVTFGFLAGVGNWGYLGLAAISMAVVIALGVWLLQAENRVMAVAIGAIIGGAVGNVIDRLRFGAVVDFIHFHIFTNRGDYSWYVFNIADAVIVCGVVTLIVDTQWRRKPPPPPEDR